MSCGAAWLVLWIAATPAGQPVPFVRGDPSHDGVYAIDDVLSVVAYLFEGEGDASCDDSVDVDDDGRLTLTDAVVLLQYVLRRGPPPAPPFGSCGTDGTEDALECSEFLSCSASRKDRYRRAWAQRFIDEPVSVLGPCCIALDGAGQVVVTGTASNTALTTSVFNTLKYAANGVKLWDVQSHRGRECQTAAMAVDGEGSVYVTGHCSSVTALSDFLTLKYRSEGSESWRAAFDGWAGSRDEARALAIDGAGHCYVAGQSAGERLAPEQTIVKYGPDGSELWVVRDARPDWKSSGCRAIALDRRGHACVLGEATLEAGAGSRLILSVYSPEGSRQWQLLLGDGAESSMGSSVAIDGADHCFVTGSVERPGNSTGRDLYTARVSSDGALLWERDLSGEGDSSEHAVAMALDAQGNVLVTAQSWSPGKATRLLVIKYDPRGRIVWERAHGGDASSAAWPTGLFVDGNNDVFICGAWLASSEADTDLLVLKHSGNGELLWQDTYDGSAMSSDVATGIVVDPEGAVYVTGSSVGEESGNDFVTIRYDPIGER